MKCNEQEKKNVVWRRDETRRDETHQYIDSIRCSASFQTMRNKPPVDRLLDIVDIARLKMEFLVQTEAAGCTVYEYTGCVDTRYQERVPRFVSNLVVVVVAVNALNFASLNSIHLSHCTRPDPLHSTRTTTTTFAHVNYVNVQMEWRTSCTTSCNLMFFLHFSISCMRLMVTQYRRM